MRELRGLKVIKDETPPLAPAALQEYGNEIATKVRQAAIDAVRQSMHSVYLERGLSLTPANLRAWRHQARTALAAWQRVDDLTSELLHEVEKTRLATGKDTD